MRPFGAHAAILPLTNVYLPNFTRKSLPHIRSRLPRLYAAFFCPALSFAPSLAGTPQSFCGRMVTWCASQQERSVVFSLFPLAAIFHAHLAFCAAPSCAVTPRILFGSVDLLSRMFPNRLTTQSLKLLGLYSRPVTAPACAQREAPEAHFVDSTLLPPRVFLMRPNCIGG